jgi:hypothetical protein
MPDDAVAASGGSASQVKDDSYQAIYLGTAGQQLNHSISSTVHPAPGAGQNAVSALAARLSGLVRGNAGGAPLVLAGLLLALTLGLGFRTRRWIVRRGRD